MRLSHILDRVNHTYKSLRKIASNISDLSNKCGGGWEDCGAAGIQTTALQDI